MKRKRISRKIIALIGFMEIVAMLILYFVANFHITKILKTKAIHDMNVIARDRAHLVEMYINECCHFLDNYSKSYEVRELLKHDTDDRSISAADRLTRRYAESRDDLEGLYTAKWDTYVLVHTNPKSAGQTFRDAKSAKTLESTIKKHDKAFCTGIVLAPVTKTMVIPVYAPVYDEKKNAIGFIGAAFYTDFLKNALIKLTDSNMSGTGYALINTNTDTYIFNSDSGQIGEKCTNSALLKSLKTLTSSGYRGENIHYTYKNHVIVCHNIKEWNWVFVLKDSSSDVYRTIARVRIQLIIVCLLILACMLTVLAFSVNRQMRPVKAIKMQINRLKAGDYSPNPLIEQYCSREDEFGTIADAIKELHSVMENQYELFLEMLEAQTVGTLITDAEDQNIILINAMAMKLYGFDPARKDTLTMDDIRSRFDAEETEKIKKIREDTSSSKEELIYETFLTREDGTKVYVLSHAKSVTLSNGDSVVIFSFVDISDRKELEEKLRIRSETDYLTNICNRRSGEHRIEALVKEMHNGMFCLFDVNKFKLINDNFGHAAGDDVLVAIADTMKRTFQNSDVLVRLGGDEFAIFVKDVTDEADGSRCIEQFIEQIGQIDLPVLNGHKISISLGAVIIMEEMTFSQMYAQADSLMYDCKKMGKSAYKFYTV